MTPSTKVYVACDHAGFNLKAKLLVELRKEFPKLEFEDLGCHSEESTDYSPLAKTVARKVMENNARGVLICGSGIGMSMAANKVAGIRACTIWDATSARLSREHNDANVLCLGARLSGTEVIYEICRVWLLTVFAGGRHARRVAQIDES